MVLACVLTVARVDGSGAQTAAVSPPAPAGPVFTTAVDVVATTPVAGAVVDRDKVPANVQTIDVGVAPRAGVAVTDWLRTSSSISLNEAQNNPFQPDLQFRGFTASPLLGLPPGLVLFQDGVRVNEPFGDTVNWDLLPLNAIQRLDLLPGANPAFGNNALGGAIVVETKNGFRNQGQEAALSGGSFGRASGEGSAGGHIGRAAYFVAARMLVEDGWREHSPSRIRQGFAGVDWQGSDRTALSLKVTGAGNRLVGNGVSPVQLLAEDRRAVFTHPDRTSNALALVSGRLRRTLTPRITLDAVIYARPSRVVTFNADDTAYERCDVEAGAPGSLCIDGAPALDPSGRAVPVVLGRIELDATNNTSLTRNRGLGGSVQLTRTAPVLGRANQLAVGLTFDGARSRYQASTEFAALTADRGTVGSGLIDGDSRVSLRTATSHVGLYATNFFDLTSRLTLSGALRLNRSQVDLHDQIGDDLNGRHQFVRLNPSVGATFSLSAAVTAYASLGMTSRAPTPSELSCADPDDACRLPNAFVADPPLAQVRARTVEGGLRGTLGTVTWMASLFRATNHDDIIFVSSGALTNQGYFQNVGQTRREGMEVALSTSPVRLLQAAASYTWLNATLETPVTMRSPHHPANQDGEIAVARGSRLPGLPRHSARVTGRLAGRRASLEARLDVASSQYLRGDDANLLDPVRGYVTLGASGRLHLTRRIEALVDVANLTNAAYETFGVLADASGVLGEQYDDPRFLSAGAPRAAWMGLRLRF